MTIAAYLITIIISYLPIAAMFSAIPFVGGFVFWALLDFGWFKLEGGHIPIVLMLAILLLKILMYYVGKSNNLTGNRVGITRFTSGALATEIIGLSVFIVLSFFAYSPTRWI